MERFLDTLPIEKAIQAIYYAIRILRHAKAIWPNNVDSESSSEEKGLGEKIIDEIILRENQLLSEIDKKTCDKYIIELSNYLERRNKDNLKSSSIKKTEDLRQWRNEPIHKFDTREYNQIHKPRVFISYPHDSKGDYDEMLELFNNIDIEVYNYANIFIGQKSYINTFIEAAALIDLSIFILSDASHLRENQLFELGYLYGKLGRNRVILLVESDISVPSDLAGFKYLSMHSGNWKYELIKYIDLAGIRFDKDKLRGG